MDDNWDDWRIAHAAWHHGSFTAAAEALGIGQATVSRRVAALEEQLGQVLFDRHRNGLVPTPAAHDLRPQLEAMVAAAHGLAHALDGFEAEPEGTVTIAAPPGLCVDLVPQLAGRLARRYPKLCLEALADIRRRAIGRREADLALRFMPTDTADLLVRRLTDVATGLFASPAFVARLPANVALSEVPLVQWSDPYAHIPMARGIASLGGPIVFRSNSYLALRAAVQQGVGACPLSVQEAEALGLVKVPVPFRGPDVPLYLVVHPALRRVPRVAVVMEAIEAFARGRHSDGQAWGR